MRDFAEDIKIGINKLEDDLEEHPSIYMHYCEIQAKYLNKEAKLKRRLRLKEIELYQKISSEWEDYFDKKPSETNIKRWINSDSEYLKIEDSILEISHELDILSSIKKSLEMKTKSLTSLTSLYMSGLYTPKIAQKQDKAIRPNNLKKRN